MSVTQNVQVKHTDSDEIDLGKLFGVLLDSRWVIILSTFLFAIFGIAYALLATPIYKADALVQVEEKSTGVPGLSDMSDMFASESSADTEIQILKSRMVIGNTVDKLNLTVNVAPKYLPIIGKGLARIQGEKEPVLAVAKLELSNELIGEKLTFTVLSDEQYAVYYDGEELISAKRGELAQKGELSVLVTDIVASKGNEFSVVKNARLVTVSDLQMDLKISEQGKKNRYFKTDP